MKLDASHRFEAKADAFYRETGVLAPGKDSADWSASDEERRALWSDFNKVYGKVIDHVLAAVGALPGFDPKPACDTCDGNGWVPDLSGNFPSHPGLVAGPFIDKTECKVCDGRGSRELTVEEWLDIAPPDVTLLLRDSVPLQNALSDVRNRAFQCIGAYDGCMDATVKQMFQREYETLGHLLQFANPV